MKTFICLLTLILLHTCPLQAQYYVTSANHALPQIDSFIVKYGIQEHLISTFSFDHIGSTESRPITDIKLTQNHSTYIPLEKWNIFQSDTISVKVCHIKVNKANRLSLSLKNFHLSTKGKLYFYNEDRSVFAGPISHLANNKVESFSTLDLNSDEMTIVLIEPHLNKKDLSSRLTIEQVNSSKIKRQEFLGKSNVEAFNNSPNAACFFPEWRYEADAVARMLLPDGTCSCTLLNNENNDRIPYVMTSRHCITSSEFDPHNVTADDINKLNSTNFQFLYRYSDCSGNYDEQSFVVSSATYLDSYFWTDHLFIRLNNANLPPTLNYVGWDRSGYGIGAQFYVSSISHPSGERQKYASGTATNPGSDGHKYGVAWSIGYTEPGSSGSALFNQYHKFVGQLSYVITHDNYGKFSEAWSTPYGGVQSWLSPSQNLNSIGSLIPTLITLSNDNPLCYGSTTVASMPNLKSTESVTWTVSANLSIVSTTNKSVTVAPSSPTASGVGIITGTIAGQQKVQNITVGVPQQATLQIYNYTTSTFTNLLNNSTVNFCTDQDNYLEVQNINYGNGGNVATGAEWTFPGTWNPTVAYGGVNGEAVGVNTSFYGGTFSVKVSNQCGWQQTPTYIGVNMIYCTGYYAYTISPNPATDNLIVEFEKTNEQKRFPEALELVQESQLDKSNVARTWAINDENKAELKQTRKIAFDVKDLPRGRYILRIRSEHDESKVKGLHVILE